MRLTAEQQGLIEKSQWIVNDVLKYYGVGYDNDLRQAAMLYMCKCLERYEPERGKWETYAYTNVKYYVVKYMRRQKAERARTVAQDEDTSELPSTEADATERRADARLRVKRMLECCDAEERGVVIRLLAGHSKSRVARRIGKSPQTVSGIIRSVREKYIQSCLAGRNGHESGENVFFDKCIEENGFDGNNGK